MWNAKQGRFRKSSHGLPLLGVCVCVIVGIGCGVNGGQQNQTQILRFIHRKYDRVRCERASERTGMHSVVQFLAIFHIINIISLSTELNHLSGPKNVYVNAWMAIGNNEWEGLFLSSRSWFSSLSQSYFCSVSLSFRPTTSLHHLSPTWLTPARMFYLSLLCFIQTK